MPDLDHARSQDLLFFLLRRQVILANETQAKAWASLKDLVNELVVSVKGLHEAQCDGPICDAINLWKVADRRHRPTGNSGYCLGVGSRSSELIDSIRRNYDLDSCRSHLMVDVPGLYWDVMFDKECVSKTIGAATHWAKSKQQTDKTHIFIKNGKSCHVPDNIASYKALADSVFAKYLLLATCEDLFVSIPHPLDFPPPENIDISISRDISRNEWHLAMDILRVIRNFYVNEKDSKEDVAKDYLVLRETVTKKLDFPVLAMKDIAVGLLIQEQLDLGQTKTNAYDVISDQWGNNFFGVSTGSLKKSYKFFKKTLDEALQNPCEPVFGYKLKLEES